MKTILLVVIILFCTRVQSQEAKNEISLRELQELALDNNYGLRAEKSELKRTELSVKKAFTFPRTEIYEEYDENDLAPNGIPNHKLGIHQDLEFPTVYSRRKRVNLKKKDLQFEHLRFETASLMEKITQQYYYIAYLENRKTVLGMLDSLYADFSRSARNKNDSTNIKDLEIATVLAKYRKISTDYISVNNELEMAYEEMHSLIQHDTTFHISAKALKKVDFSEEDTLSSPGIRLYQSRKRLSEEKLKLEKHILLPAFGADYFIASNRGLNSYLHGYHFGIKLPLLYFGDKAEIAAKKMEVETASYEQKNYEIRLISKRKQLQATVDRFKIQLAYYESEGISLADQIIEMARRSYKQGNIDFFQYAKSLEDAQDFRLDYLEVLYEYNKAAIGLNYLIL